MNHIRQISYDFSLKIKKKYRNKIVKLKCRTKVEKVLLSNFFKIICIYKCNHFLTKIEIHDILENLKKKFKYVMNFHFKLKILHLEIFH